MFNGNRTNYIVVKTVTFYPSITMVDALSHYTWVVLFAVGKHVIQNPTL